MYTRVRTDIHTRVRKYVCLYVCVELRISGRSISYQVHNGRSLQKGVWGQVRPRRRGREEKKYHKWYPTSTYEDSH